MQGYFGEEQDRYSTITPRKKERTDGDRKDDGNDPGENKVDGEIITDRSIAGKKEKQSENLSLMQRQPVKRKIQFVKENKRGILIGILCTIVLICSIAGALYLYQKNTKQQEKQTEEQEVIDTTDYEKIVTVSGKKVKERLNAWCEEDHYAFLVATKALIKDEISYDINFLKYITNERTVSCKTILDGESYDVKAINYGNCFSEGLITKNGVGFRFYGNLLEEPVTYEGHDENGEMSTLISMPASNKWDEVHMPINDNDEFLEYELYDGNGKLAGCIYVTY